MKKIILSVAVAAMALSTTASALEDIKVSGQAKLWYETNDKGDNSLTDTASSSGEVVFKLGMTGKQGNVGFGTTIYQTSTMGLEGTVVGATRTNSTNLGNAAVAGDGANSTGNSANGQMYVGEAYITAPVIGDNLVKIGKQELDTPLAFTERWNAAPNTFNAAVLVNNSVDNLTLIGAYVGQGNTETWAVDGEVANRYNGDVTGGTFAAGALYKTDAFSINVWGYELTHIAQAFWADASVKAGPVAIKAYAATMMPDADNTDDTVAFALSAGGKAGPVTLFAAGSQISDDGVLPVANTATGFKKTKLPTAGVYTDGRFVAQPGSTAFKLKVSGKAGTTGLALQGIMNTNSNDYNEDASGDNG